jgi:hypothetical protein
LLRRQCLVERPSRGRRISCSGRSGQCDAAEKE